MSGSVSLVNGHIDPDKNEITSQQAIKYFEEEILMLENAPNLNGCEMTDEWREQIEICKLAISAIEKQIPKKVTHEASIFKCCTCPNCKNVVDEFTDFNGQRVRITYNSCKFCGQTLDFSLE